jgi:hypothetical protein
MHSWALPSLMFAFTLINIWKAGYPKVQGSLLAFHILELFV